MTKPTPISTAAVLVQAVRTHGYVVMLAAFVVASVLFTHMLAKSEFALVQAAQEVKELKTEYRVLLSRYTDLEAAVKNQCKAEVGH